VKGREDGGFQRKEALPIWGAGFLWHFLNSNFWGRNVDFVLVVAAASRGGRDQLPVVPSSPGPEVIAGIQHCSLSKRSASFHVFVKLLASYYPRCTCTGMSISRGADDVVT
jgi:hypothetical protein